MANVVLVVVTARQVRLTREALEATRDAVKAAQGEAEATAASVRVAQEQLGVSAKVVDEAVRARVDEHAPRVVVTQVDPNKYVWSPSTGGGDPNPLDRIELMKFRIAEQGHEPFFVRGELHVRNEGASSSWVT